jgi:hypothetical protein
LILLTLGIIAAGGLRGTLLAILGALFLCLLASVAMPSRGRHNAGPAGQSGESILPGALALVALAVNFAGFAGLWVFMERIAVDRGYDSDFINLWLAVGLITSGVGPLIAAAVSDRLGRIRPLLISTVAALASMMLLGGEVSRTAYALALTLLPLTYYFGISYIFSVVATADTNGRISGLMSFALAVGSAAGPALFGAAKAANGPVLSLLIISIARKQSFATGVSDT